MTATLSLDRFQLYTWDFPRMTVQEREAALGYRIRATVPLAPERYRFFVTWFQQPRGLRAVVAVVVAAAPSEESIRMALPFPARTRKGHPWDIFSTGEGETVFLVYQKGLFHSLLRTYDPVSTRARLEEEYPGCVVHKDHPRGPRLELGRVYRFGVPLWMPWGLWLLAGIFLALGGLRAYDQRAKTIQAWEDWIQSYRSSLPSDSTQRIEGPLREELLGFPLVRVSEALAAAWGSSATIVKMTTKGRTLSLEVLARDSVEALGRLRAQQGFEEFQLTQTVKGPEGQRFQIEGVVHLDP